MSEPRYRVESAIIKDVCYDSKYNHDMSIPVIVDRLNKQEELIRLSTTVTDDFIELTMLMTDNNLTWKSVTNIIKEALL